ncbi:hypothetical protein PV327_006554 [Microctonus hyperodae]|uniref:Metalloendopeptidase n=1 Tax=Microctonus hyperodae TaxID=165561 RepID=A0AA39F4L2_MICHY|nr:hypothetical protein PV327_006554 [Microctonus hyperodae]
MDPYHDDELGQRHGFSKLDVEKINRMYQCKKEEITGDIEQELENRPKPQPKKLKINMYRSVVVIIVFICFVFIEGKVASSAKKIKGFPHNHRGHSASNNSSYKINLKYLGNRIYGLPNEESGARVAKWNKNLRVNPEELGSYAEGDILFSTPTMKTALAPEYYRWPGGIVPYAITGYFTSEEYSKILSAINDFHKYTCVRFVPYNGQKAHIRISSRWAGCFSTVGYGGVSYDVNLQPPYCLTLKGTILHELMHAIGFIHEHSRHDRDDYIYILEDNIYPGFKEFFNKYEEKDVDTFGVPYDFDSVMHYSRNAFSFNGKETILPKYNTDVNIGIRENFSQGDIDKINRMYRCVAAPTTAQNFTPVYPVKQKKYRYSPQIRYLG